MDIPLLTEGPLALFFGGKEIIPHLSTASVTSSNMPFYFLVVLSLLLQLFLETYKRCKFRKEIRYEQQLQQAVFSGVRNVYGQIFIFMGCLVWCAVLGTHFYLAEKNQEIKNLDDPSRYSAVGPFIMVIIFSVLIFMPFVKNHKIRFEEIVTLML